MSGGIRPLHSRGLSLLASLVAITAGHSIIGLVFLRGINLYNQYKTFLGIKPNLKIKVFYFMSCTFLLAISYLTAYFIPSEQADEINLKIKILEGNNKVMIFMKHDLLEINRKFEALNQRLTIIDKHFNDATS